MLARLLLVRRSLFIYQSFSIRSVGFYSASNKVSLYCNSNRSSFAVERFSHQRINSVVNNNIAGQQQDRQFSRRVQHNSDDDTHSYTQEAHEDRSENDVKICPIKSDRILEHLIDKDGPIIAEDLWDEIQTLGIVETKSKMKILLNQLRRAKLLETRPTQVKKKVEGERQMKTKFGYQLYGKLFDFQAPRREEEAPITTTISSPKVDNNK